VTKNGFEDENVFEEKEICSLYSVSEGRRGQKNFPIGCDAANEPA